MQWICGQMGDWWLFLLWTLGVYWEEAEGSNNASWSSVPTTQRMEWGRFSKPKLASWFSNPSVKGTLTFFPSRHQQPVNPFNNHYCPLSLPSLLVKFFKCGSAETCQQLGTLALTKHLSTVCNPNDGLPGPHRRPNCTQIAHIHTCKSSTHAYNIKISKSL